MADVYDAVDNDTGRRVAVKVLRGVDNPLDARRFAAEIRTTARLAHPCIVTLLDAGEHQGAPYLVMERVAGGSLAERVRQGPVPAPDVARIGAQVAAALAHAHEAGIIHRDVKPANVLLDENGHARLADFGIAVSATATRLTVSGSVAGSAAYVAPEQVLGDAVGPGADVYALGLVLLECLLGRPVYSGTAVEAALARLTRDPEIPAELPDDWVALLRRMTAGKPQRRPNADTAAQTLAGLATLTATPSFYAVPFVSPEAPTDPGLTIRPLPPSARRRQGSRAVALLGSTIAGVFLTGVGALALPALQQPAAQLAAADPWAPTPGTVTQAAASDDTLDEERIVAELRRWAGRDSRLTSAPAAATPRRPAPASTPVASAPKLPAPPPARAPSAPRRVAAPVVQVAEPVRGVRTLAALKVPVVSVSSGTTLPVEKVTASRRQTLSTTTTTVTKTKKKVGGKLRQTADSVLDVRSLRGPKRRR